MSRRACIDIEAVPRTDPPDFDNPTGNWSTFAIALSQQTAASSMPETTVLVREDSSDHGLCKLLAAAANWLHERAPHDALVTYNGESFDFRVLDDHIETELSARDDALAGYVRSALDAPHRDLFREIVENQSDDVKWPSLAESLSSRGLAKAPARLDGKEIGGADMPELGERLLSGEGLSVQQERALREYASSDVVPLHALAASLDRERQASAEADVVTDGGRDD